jgi:hypothetical protein
MKMMKCHLTGIFLQGKDAYVLDIANVKRAIQELKNKTFLFEKLMNELGCSDKVEIKDAQKGGRKVQRRRRLICDNLAIAYNKMYYGHEIFIPWNEFLDKITKKKINQT